jgi:hypothetical protein
MAPPRDKNPDRRKDERESAEPPEDQQNRERQGPGHPKEDERVDHEAAETFPASDPPANY